jgi:hypothetical protein
MGPGCPEQGKFGAATWPGETPGASCGLYRRGGPGSQAGPFRFPPRLGEMGLGVVQGPKPDPVGVRPFRPAWGGNCGLCLGVWSVRWGRGGLGELMFHPTWSLLFSSILITRLNDIMPYIYIYIWEGQALTLPSVLGRRLDQFYVLSCTGDRDSSKLCLSSSKRMDKNFQYWIAGICVPSEIHQSRPSQTCNHIHVVTQYKHFSYKLEAFRGFLYCGECGSRKRNSLIRYLAVECCPPSDAGKATLLAIQSGKLPRGIGE